jgi:integrase
VRPKERVRLLALGDARALLYTLALGTGLRRGELQQLRWADLDLERGLVTVTAASA